MPGKECNAFSGCIIPNKSLCNYRFIVYPTRDYRSIGYPTKLLLCNYGYIGYPITYYVIMDPSYTQQVIIDPSDTQQIFIM